MSAKTSLFASSSNRFSGILFLGLVAFPVVRGAATLVSRSGGDASRLLLQGVAQGFAAGYGKTGQGLEHWVRELGAMLEGGFHEIGGRRERSSLPLFH